MSDEYLDDLERKMQDRHRNRLPVVAGAGWQRSCPSPAPYPFGHYPSSRLNTAIKVLDSILTALFTLVVGLVAAAGLVGLVGALVAWLFTVHVAAGWAGAGVATVLLLRCVLGVLRMAHRDSDGRWYLGFVYLVVVLTLVGGAVLAVAMVTSAESQNVELVNVTTGTVDWPRDRVVETHVPTAPAEPWSVPADVWLEVER